MLCICILCCMRTYTPTNSILPLPPPTPFQQKKVQYSTCYPITRIAPPPGTPIQRYAPPTKSHSPHVPRRTKTYDAVPGAAGIPWSIPCMPAYPPHIHPSNGLISPRYNCSCSAIRHPFDIGVGTLVGTDAGTACTARLCSAGSAGGVFVFVNKGKGVFGRGRGALWRGAGGGFEVHVFVWRSITACYMDEIQSVQSEQRQQGRW